MEDHIRRHQAQVRDNISKSIIGNDEGLECYTPESLNLYKNDLKKSLDSHEMSPQDFAKAMKDLSRLAMRKITDKNGHQKIVYVKVTQDENGQSKEKDFEAGHAVKFNKDGKEHVGKIHSLKFNEKTDKVGTATVEVGGTKHSVSLSKLEHHDEPADKDNLELKKQLTYHAEKAQFHSEKFADHMKERMMLKMDSTEWRKHGEEADKHEIKRKFHVEEHKKLKQANVYQTPVNEESNTAPSVGAMIAKDDREKQKKYEESKRESNKGSGFPPNSRIGKNTKDKSEKTIMEEIDGKDSWTDKAKAIHLAKHLGKDEDFIKNLNQWKVGSSTIQAKLKGLEDEYMNKDSKKEDETDSGKETIKQPTPEQFTSEVLKIANDNTLSIYKPKVEKFKDNIYRLYFNTSIIRSSYLQSLVGELKQKLPKGYVKDNDYSIRISQGGATEGDIMLTMNDVENSKDVKKSIDDLDIEKAFSKLGIIEEPKNEIEKAFSKLGAL